MRIQILILGFKGLSGNARGTAKWPLNGGWPLNRGLSETCKSFGRIIFILKQTRNGSSITGPIGRHLSRTPRLVEGSITGPVGSITGPIGRHLSRTPRLVEDSITGPVGSITGSIGRHLSRTARLVEGSRLRGVG